MCACRQACDGWQKVKELGGGEDSAEGGCGTDTERSREHVRGEEAPACQSSCCGSSASSMYSSSASTTWRAQARGQGSRRFWRAGGRDQADQSSRRGDARTYATRVRAHTHSGGEHDRAHKQAGRARSCGIGFRARTPRGAARHCPWPAGRAPARPPTALAAEARQVRCSAVTPALAPAHPDPPALIGFVSDRSRCQKWRRDGKLWSSDARRVRARCRQALTKLPCTATGTGAARSARWTRLGPTILTSARTVRALARRTKGSIRAPPSSQVARIRCK